MTPDLKVLRAAPYLTIEFRVDFAEVDSTEQAASLERRTKKTLLSAREPVKYAMRGLRTDVL
jgi:hypothetical protein